MQARTDINRFVSVAGGIGLVYALALGVYVATASAAVLIVTTSVALVALGAVGVRALRNAHTPASSEIPPIASAQMEMVSDAGREVGAVAEELTGGCAQLAHRTAQQSLCIEDTAAITQALGEAVKRNATTAAHTSRLAASAKLAAEQSNATMVSAVSTLAEMASSGHKIVDIIAVINDIAFQTNILALNAAVEAARAGEQGRGFAVVATEVRQLAHRSADAAKQIKSLITESVARVQDGKQAVGEAAEAIDDVVTHAQLIVELIADIAQAGEDQGTAIARIDEALAYVGTTTRENAVFAQEVGTASTDLSDQARNLNMIVNEIVKIVDTIGPGTTATPSAPAALAGRLTLAASGS